MSDSSLPMSMDARGSAGDSGLIFFYARKRLSSARSMIYLRPTWKNK